MQLFLVQHGKAKDRDEDPERPLTDEGRREVEAVMVLMLRAGAVTASRVLHSGKQRSAETAEIIATKLDADTEEADGLAPDDDPEIWRRRLDESQRDTVLVGHMPHLSRLASVLLGADPDAEVVAFTNGGVVCLQRQKDHRWSLRWAVTPGLIK